MKNYLIEQELLSPKKFREYAEDELANAKRALNKDFVDFMKQNREDER